MAYLLLLQFSTASEAEEEVERGPILDVVVGQGASILELLAGKDQALVVGVDAPLEMDLGLDIVDGGVGRLDLEGDGLVAVQGNKRGDHSDDL